MKAIPGSVLGWAALVATFLAVAGCTAPRGTIMLDPQGKSKDVTPEEIDRLSGADTTPYLMQVGDKIGVQFRVREFRDGETPWDYRIEVGDNMEVRFSAPLGDTAEYKIDVGDLLGISFLSNWQLNSNRTVRPDGFITMPQVGDIKATGMTAKELEKKLNALYKKTGIIQGDPMITVNVDFSNPDRLENMSRDVVVRPDGAIRVPGIDVDVHIAGMTVAEAGAAVKEASVKKLANAPDVSLVVFPFINNALTTMNGQFAVRPDGKFSVPKIGDVQAAGYSVEEVRQYLSEVMSAMNFNDVEASVDLVQASGARIYVGGETKVNGVLPLEGSPTALSAILMAQGPTEDSRLNSVLVIRRNPNGKPYVFKTNLAKVLKNGATENDILLRAFDIVYVPKKNISKADLFVQQYIDEIVPFDNSLGVSGTYYLNTQKTQSRTKNLNGGFTIVPSTDSIIGGVINP